MRESIKRNRDLLLRVLAALAVGLAIASTAYLCAFYELRRAYNNGFNSAPFQLRRLQADIEDYKQTKGHWPQNLSEVHRQDHDPWGRPYHYEVEGYTYVLYSLGRDGQPGGEGLDADIYAGQPAEKPTFKQFTFELPTEEVKTMCFLAGVCAGLVCLFQTRKRGWGIFFMRLGATAIGAVFAAIAISTLHIVSGH